jgi:hypothetical protein
VRENMEPDYWQAKLTITQIPCIERLRTNNKSWLGNAFGDSHVYGTTFHINDEKFRWEFFFNEDDRIEAMLNAETWKYYLMERFPGLMINTRVLPIHEQMIESSKKFFELVLPIPQFYTRINFTTKILNIFNQNQDVLMNTYILWQADDSRISGVEKTKLEENLKMDENYKIKIFIHVESRHYPIDSVLNYLKSDIQNVIGERAEIIHAPTDTWKNILSGNVFFKNFLNKITGRYYLEFRSSDCSIVPQGKMPGFVSPKIIDFNIDENFPIKKAFELSDERMYFLSPNSKYKIFLGNYMKDGAVLDRKTFIHLNDFTHHAFISGLSGFGKTSFLAQLNERVMNTGKVGVMVINLLKKIDVGLFNPDILLDKTEPQFRIPWITFNESVETSTIIDEVAEYVVASLGLKNVAVTHMANALTNEMLEKGTLPRSLKKAFEKTWEWEKKRPYHEKFQTNLLRAIENRVLRLLSQPRLEQILDAGLKPEWFTQWLGGKSIVIDLSSFTKSVKRLLVHGIFQLVHTHCPDLTLEEQYSQNVKDLKIKNMIIMDEVGDIFTKPRNQSVDDDETVTRHYLELVFERYLSSFRSRGIALILADQRPSRLFEGVYSLPSNKLLFKTDLACLQKFTLSSEDAKIINGLRRRQVFFDDGPNSRKFIFMTTKHDPFKLKRGDVLERDQR